MFYFSAVLAILGAVGYQYFIKLVPSTINPIISVMAIYLCVMVFSLCLLPLYPSEGNLGQHVRQLSWVQIAVAISVFFIELGFLLMYRFGWNLTTANVTTGVFINLLLIALGIFILGEKISFINAIGIALSIVGVALIGYRPANV